MKRIEIKICVGTACYVIGGSELMSLNEFLPKEIAEHVDIKFSECMEECNDDPAGKKPPYISINQKIMSGATLEKVLDAITEILKED